MALATFLSNPVVQRGLSAAAQAFTGVPAAPSAPTQAETQRQQAEMLGQRAFQAALTRPDMPIPPEFSTGSALVDEQARLRARYTLMRDAARSAVAERARAQGRSVTYDQAGNPVIGDMPQTPIVQAGPEGTRIAYRNGIPVGFSTPTATPSAEEMRFNQPYRSDAAAREAQIQKETAALPAEQRASIAARLGVENTPAAIARSLSAGVSATRSSMAGSPEQGEEIRRQATALAAQQRATEIMRSGAQKFNADNAARGVQMTPTGGYLMTPMGAASAAAAPAAAAPVAAPAVRAPVPMPASQATPAAPVQFTPEEIMDPESAALEQQAAAVLEQERVRPIQAAEDAQTREFIRTRAARIADLQKATVARDPAKIQAALNSLRMLKEPVRRQPRAATPEPAALPPGSEGYEMSQLLGARPMTSQELNRLTPRQYDELVRQAAVDDARIEAFNKGERQAEENFTDFRNLDIFERRREYDRLSRLNPELYPPFPKGGNTVFGFDPLYWTNFTDRPEPIR